MLISNKFIYQPNYYIMFGVNEEPTYTATLNKPSAKALINRILKDDCPNKDLIAEYFLEQIGGSFSDFIYLFSGNIPEPLFSVGDRVRITKRAASLYDVDYQQTTASGYMLAEGIYCEIQHISRCRKDCYRGIISYITTSGKEEYRERCFSDADIMIDNTIVLNASTSNVAKIL